MHLAWEITYLFSWRCYCFFSQGAAVWAWGPLCTKQVASYNHFKGASFMGHWNRLRESRTISKSLPSLQRLCLFTLVFTGDRRATGLQDHHPFLQNLVAPIPRVGLCDALLSQPPRKITGFAWPEAFAICLCSSPCAGMQMFEGRHHIVLFCFIQYLAKRKEKGILAFYQVSKLLK